MICEKSGVKKIFAINTKNKVLFPNLFLSKSLEQIYSNWHLLAYMDFNIVVTGLNHST